VERGHDLPGGTLAGSTGLQELWLVDGVGADGDVPLQPSRCSAARGHKALDSGRVHWARRACLPSSRRSSAYSSSYCQPASLCVHERSHLERMCILSAVPHWGTEGVHVHCWRLVCGSQATIIHHLTSSAGHGGDQQAIKHAKEALQANLAFNLVGWIGQQLPMTLDSNSLVYIMCGVPYLRSISLEAFTALRRSSLRCSTWGLLTACLKVAACGLLEAVVILGARPGFSAPSRPASTHLGSTLQCPALCWKGAWTQQDLCVSDTTRKKNIGGCELSHLLQSHIGCLLLTVW
jgi:hypothetical protein